MRAISRVQRGIAAALVAGAIGGCATVTDRTVSAARSTPGRMGFGATRTTQSMFGGALSLYRTGVAGSSSASIETGGGDWIWRIAPGGFWLELCHAPWSEQPCRRALFDGAPNPMFALASFGGYPVLIDPVNLGNTAIVSSDGRRIWVMGDLSYEVQSIPVASDQGVWALGGQGVLHRCQLEGETPRCRAARSPDGAALAGEPLALKIYGAGLDAREGIWIHRADTFFHCEAKAGDAASPVCSAVKSAVPLAAGDTALHVFRPLSSHAIASGGVFRHVVWLESLGGSILRCSARGGEAPECALAKRE